MADELESANDARINMKQMAMTDKEKITTITRTLTEFTKRFVVMEAKLYRVIAGKTGTREST